MNKLIISNIRVPDYDDVSPEFTMRSSVFRDCSLSPFPLNFVVDTAKEAAPSSCEHNDEKSSNQNMRTTLGFRMKTQICTRSFSVFRTVLYLCPGYISHLQNIKFRCWTWLALSQKKTNWIKWMNLGNWAVVSRLMIVYRGDLSLGMENNRLIPTHSRNLWYRLDVHLVLLVGSEKSVQSTMMPRLLMLEHGCLRDIGTVWCTTHHRSQYSGKLEQVVWVVYDAWSSDVCSLTGNGSSCSADHITKGMKISAGRLARVCPVRLTGWGPWDDFRLPEDNKWYGSVL